MVFVLFAVVGVIVGLDSQSNAEEAAVIAISDVVTCKLAFPISAVSTCGCPSCLVGGDPICVWMILDDEEVSTVLIMLWLTKPEV